jgi:hypothetical protein
MLASGVTRLSRQEAQSSSGPAAGNVQLHTPADE